MDIDKSKENIQPLRGGRNLHQLEVALQAQADHDAHRTLQAQKEEHEAIISSYEGPDPLDPWFNYIQWVEQCFPKHGHEGHIDKLIKECLQIFEKDERYYQDRRFVKLWIKYIDCLTNPLEIYQRLHNSGIGVECSELYRAWACYCEESGEYKKANQVFMMGLQAHAQPYDELEQAHKDFQLYFAQRMLHDDSPTKRKAASALAETRQALTSLKTFKRRNIANVPSQRTGENVHSFIPGTVRQQAGGSQAHRGPGSNIMVNVFEDAPSTSQMAATTCEQAGPASLLQGLVNVENEKEVGIWTNAKTKMVHANLVPHQPLPFTPYEDEDLILSANHMQYCLDDLTTYVVPLSVPEPPDPTKIICYNKAMVYVDNTEYSLEEIRARKYISKKTAEAQHLAQALSTPYYACGSFSAQDAEAAASCSALETLANCALGSEHDLEQLMPLAIPTLQNITKVHNIHSPGEPKILVNLDSKEFSELSNPSYRKNDENQQPMESSLEKKAGVMATNSYGDENKFADDFNRSLVRNLHADSITQNTKEARWELRNLFTDNETSMVQPIIQQFDRTKFDILEDCTMTMSLNIKKNPASPDAHHDDPRCPPEDKENAQKVFSVPTATASQNINKTAYYEEPSCTQVFNFNIKNSSTPNTSQFKKPNSYMEMPTKMPNMRKFQIEDASMDTQGIAEMPIEKREEISRSELPAEQQGVGDTQANGGLSVIMESTREFNSKSSSGSSGMQSTRTTLTGYSTRESQAPYGERTHTPNMNYDSMYSHQPEPTTSKRTSICAQPRNANGQFAKAYTPKTQPIPEHKVASPHGNHGPVAYQTHDHQYQKSAPGYNGYSAQRTMQVHGYNMYPQGQGYSSPPVVQPVVQQNYQVQQGYQSPSSNNYQSPQHPGLQSPHHMQSPTPQPGFQSPQSNYQMGYQSPSHTVPSSPQPYGTARNDYPHDYTQANQRPQPYAQSPSFQSPPHQSQYNNMPFQRNSNYPQTGYVQQGYSHDPYHNQNAYANANHNYHNQNYNIQPNAYRHPPKQDIEKEYAYANANANQMAFQNYQSPNQSVDHNYHATHMSQNPAVTQSRPQPMQTSPNESYLKQEHPKHNMSMHQHGHKLPAHEQTYDQSKLQRNSEAQNKEAKHANSTGAVKIPNVTQSPAPYKSPTSILRSIRHEQQHGKPGPGTPDAGFSNQFLNFITSRNEPKDNANTPKFTNSPNISQKMHKNLYVSSPEQGQVPPSTSDSESKESFTARSAPTIQSAKTTTLAEKQKDLSKRQLDFEHRPEYHSEDSRDSVSKESRISSVHSRQSIQSDGLGMDMDSENSMECAAYKSTHSISLIETKDIPRPADIDFPKIIDPFNKKILNSLLEYVKFPNKTHSDGYVEVRSAPKLQTSTLISVGNHKFSVEKQLGKGNYGAVFCCLDLINNKPVALKYQKPSRPWEFYICQEIKARIKNPFMLPGYMDIELAFLGENASIFVSELSKYGSLLDVANKVRIATSKCINEFIVLLLTSEMLSIVHYLHKAEIIHADIKPDNFLLMKIPTQEWRTPSLQLIDLGCSIDMSLFPQGTTFREMISTEGFTCREMREGKPWTYQTDFYCLAGTIHVILMGSYMKVANRVGQWNIDKKLPRYMKVSLWDKIFTTLLNVPDCANLPDLMDLKQYVDSELPSGGDDTLASQLRSFANVLKSR